MLKVNCFLSLLFCSFFTLGFSQEISGIVFNSASGEPLAGASVYFDDTTIGTSANAEGEFILAYRKDIITPLVISFLGFETVMINDFSKLEDLNIFLNASTNALNEIKLTSKKDWPRELKLQEFRKNYLGETENGLASKILNEEDIILNYNRKKKQLTAVTMAPILINNGNLKYLISVNLKHFEVNYSYVSMNKKILTVKYVYFLGSNFYKSMDEPPAKITLKKRRETYLGSPLHFMRSMARQELEREKYKIYNGDYPVNSKKYISVTPIDNLNNVKVTFNKRLNILFEGDKQSFIKILVPEFYIDNFGNYSPPKAVRLGGDLGKQRIGDALPLDYLMLNN